MNDKGTGTGEVVGVGVEVKVVVGWDVYALSMAEYDRRHLVSEMY